MMKPPLRTVSRLESGRTRLPPGWWKERQSPEVRNAELAKAEAKRARRNAKRASAEAEGPK